MNTSSRHVVFVHAHPDDESIWTGGTIAALVAAGVRVSVVTCTLGELGEVIGEPYQGLVSDRADQLGGFRIAEIRAALEVLGANAPSHEPMLLGGAGTWRDSGMIGDKGNDVSRAFIHSGAAAVAQLRELLEVLAPDVVVTYDADGGYGHPDHIRAHDIVVEVCAADQLNIPTLWAVTDRQALAAGLAAMTVVPQGWQRCSVDDFASAQGELEVLLDDEAVAAKIASLKAHATQAWVADGSVSKVNPVAAYGAVDATGRARAVWALSNLQAQPVTPVEHYRFGSAAKRDVQWLIDAGVMNVVTNGG